MMTQDQLKRVRDLADEIGAAAVLHGMATYLIREMSDYGAATRLHDAVRAVALDVEKERFGNAISRITRMKEQYAAWEAEQDRLDAEREAKLAAVRAECDAELREILERNATMAGGRS